MAGPTSTATSVDGVGSPGGVADSSGGPLLAILVLVGAGLAALIAGVVPVGPEWLGSAGSVAVATAYSSALAARTGGRPLVFGVLSLLLGAAVLGFDTDVLRTGAAVMTCVVSAVLAVMATTPAVRFVGAVRECLLAVAISAIGALATLGFGPAITVDRFEYVTLGAALVGAFVVVYRLGAGLHGLGRRGAIAVVAGVVLLGVVLAYAELLRRYGTPTVVDSLLDGVDWTQDHLGAFPRPVVAAVGMPALVWGVHLRARRRQGWWLCAFGAAGTASIGGVLLSPGVSLTQGGLAVVYGVLVGLVIGYVVIRVDLFLTAPGGSRGRRAEEAAAMRPEPGRTHALF